MPQQSVASSGRSTPLANYTRSLNGNADDRYLPGYTQGLREFGPRLIETRVAFSLYGTPIPITFGQRKMQGNIVWARELEESQVTQVINGVTTTLYGYFGTFAVAFGIPGNTDSTARVIQRVWADGKLIYDTINSKRGLAPGVKFTFYDGADDQPVDPLMESFEGSGNVPAYRGIMYAVFDSLPLAAYDNKIPAITVQVGDAATTSTSTLEISSVDANSSNSVRLDNNLQRAYVYNANSESILTYDLQTESYVHKRLVSFENAAGTVVDGFGGDYWVYIEPIRKAFGMADTAEITANFALLDPYTGAIIDTIKLDQAFDFVYTTWRDAVGTEYVIMCVMSVYSNNAAQMVRIDNGQTLTLLGEEGSTVIDDEGPGVFGKSDDPTQLEFYGVNGGTPTTVAKLVLPQGYITQASTAAVTIDATFYAYDGAGSPTDISRMIYMPTLEYLVIFYNNNEKVAIDRAGNVVWRIQAAASTPNGTGLLSQMEFLAGDVSGTKYVVVNDANVVYEFDFSDGTYETYTITGSEHTPIAIVSRANEGYILSLADTTEYLTRINYKATTDNLAISDLITYLAVRAGYTVGDLEIDAGVTDTISGALFAEVTSLSEFLELLKTVYGYEVIESGAKLKVSNNSVDQTTPQHTITSDYLLEGSPSFAFRREEDIALPSRVRLTYINADIGYEWATVDAERAGVQTTNSSDNQLNLTVPFVLTAAQAKLLAYRALYNAWGFRESYTFGLEKYWIQLEPGDIIEATIDSQVYTMRCTDLTYKADYTLDVVGQSFQNFEAFYIEAFSGYTYDVTIEIPNIYEGFFLDLPYVSDVDYTSIGTAGYYYAVLPATLTDTFTTGNFYRKQGTAEWQTVNPGGSVALPYGTITTRVPPAPFGMECALNRDATINVSIEGGDVNLLASNTYANVMAGANLAAIGHPGGWELIAFLTVTLEANGTYTFSNIVRGLYNTSEMARVLAAGRLWLADGLFRHNYINGIRATADVGDKFVFLGDIDELKRSTHSFDHKFSTGFPADRTIFGVGSKLSDAEDQPVTTLNARLHSEIAPAIPNSIRVERAKADGATTIYWNDAKIKQPTLTDGEPAVVGRTTNETGDAYIWFHFPDLADIYENKDDAWNELDKRYGNYPLLLGTAEGIGTIGMSSVAKDSPRYYSDLVLPVEADTAFRNLTRIGPVQLEDESFALPQMIDLYAGEIGVVPKPVGAYTGAKYGHVWVAIVPMMTENLIDWCNQSYIHNTGGNSESRPEGRVQWHYVAIKDV